MTNRTLDRLSGIVFTLIGFLLCLGAWAMPRFEQQGAQIYEAPGLAPGLLGLALTICGLILAFRGSKPGDSARDYWDGLFGDRHNRRRAIAACILTLGYGGLLFGKIPFLLATFIFVFAFIGTFEFVLKDYEPGTHRIAAIATGLKAAIIAAVTSVAIQFVFQSLFLVQLP